MSETPAHLGGHDNRAHVDQATLEFLIERYGIRSMLDVGCGPGHNVRLAQSLGLWAYGVDGDPAVQGQAGVYAIHDFTTGHFNLNQHVPEAFFVDLVWCFEVYEHINADHSQHLWETFAVARVLFLTVAPRGFGGHHHVNELDEWEVRELLGRNGWTVDEGATSWVRQHADHHFSRNRGIVSVRSSS